MCKGNYKPIMARSITYNRLKALAARRRIPMTQLLERMCDHMEGVNSASIARVAAAALEAKPGAAMLRDVVAVFGDGLLD